jgi:hypothetical protein
MSVEFIKRLSRVSLYVIIILLCGLGWWMVHSSSEGGESLYGCDFLLSVDKKVYTVGDEVKLTLSILDTKHKVVHFYQNNEDTIYISPLENTEYRKDVSNDTVQEITLNPNKPFEINATGEVKSSGQPGMLLVDFHKLGRIVVRPGMPIGFKARPYPVKTKLSDSVGWPFSNEVILTFQLNGNAP